MKIAALTGAGAFALTLAACAPPYVHHHALKPISALRCPDSQGPLDRTSMSPDGKSCIYSDSDGAVVQLKLVSLSGDAEATLAPIETQLKTMLPAPPPPPAPPPSAAPASSAKGDHDQVDINLPGISIHAGDQQANVHVAGVHVDADGQSDNVNVHGGGGPFGRRGQFTVQANDNGAVIHSRAFGADVDDSLILVSNTPGPQGWRTVGYEAMGPRSGPLVVATVQAKSNDHDELFKAVKALTRKAARGRKD